MALTYHSNSRGYPGNLIYLTGADGVSRGTVVPAMTIVDAAGNALSPGAATALPAGTNRSGSITTGGTAQDVAAANTSRIGMTFQNTSDTVMSLTESGVTATATNGYSIAAGQAINISTSNRISVFCATTGKTFAATEY
jgi:uncharacterized protein (DUF2345 family)